jgi:hypothetical protein
MEQRRLPKMVDLDSDHRESGPMPVTPFPIAPPPAPCPILSHETGVCCNCQHWAPPSPPWNILCLV